MDLPFKELTHKVIGCAVEVHRVLSPEFQEYIYQRVMAIELKKGGIPFLEEYEISVFYKGEKMGLRRVDFWIDNTVSLEIMSCPEIG